MKHATRHSSLTRIIAIGMVCLFLVNSISRAYPDIRTNTLAPKSLVTHEDKKENKGGQVFTFDKILNL